MPSFWIHTSQRNKENKTQTCNQRLSDSVSQLDFPSEAIFKVKKTAGEKKPAHKHSTAVAWQRLSHCAEPHPTVETGQAQLIPSPADLIARDFPEVWLSSASDVRVDGSRVLGWLTTGLTLQTAAWSTASKPPSGASRFRDTLCFLTSSLKLSTLSVRGSRWRNPKEGTQFGNNL